MAAAQHRKADRYIAGELKKQYEDATIAIQRSIEVFYNRFADNNGLVSLSDARKMLDGSELKEFRMGVERFTELAKDNLDGRWTKVLNNASYKVRVSRLQALQIEMEASIQSLNVAQNTSMTGLLSDIYQDTYYRTIYDVQKGIGIGTSFAKIDADTVDIIIKRPWLENNFSSRIWGDNRRLVQNLQTEFTQAIIRGEPSKKVARQISQRMGVGLRAANRLARTEAAHIQNEASFKGYRVSGVVQKYEFLATLDEKTCSICGPLDGKVFTLAEREVAVTFPPVHANCRCDTVPYFEDEIDPGERIARNDKGETYYVPGNMSYEEWQKKYAS